MSAPASETPSSKREHDELLERNGFRRGQLFAGKYRIEGVLGEGGMGIVLLANHVDLHRTVAIKVVRSELTRNDEVVERLLAEAQAAANIRSEHVTRVLDLGRLDSGTPYIVLEYLDGRDLAALLDEHGPLPIETAVDFVLQVCDALAEAHAAGIIHRDLKPENLFLTHRPDGTPIVKLIDFGISKNLSGRDRRAALTNPAQLVGSPYYMAPEQMRGTRGVDARADLWALGVVLYELITGQTPFAADSIPAVCHLVLNENPTPPRTFAPDMSAELEAVVLCCLSKDPNARYADVSEFAEALASFATQEGLLYADRVQRVIAAAAARARGRALATSGKFARAPSLSNPLQIPIHEDLRQLPGQASFRTPPALSRTRESSFSRNIRRRSRRRLSWVAGLTAIALLGVVAFLAGLPDPEPPPEVLSGSTATLPALHDPPAPAATASADGQPAPSASDRPSAGDLVPASSSSSFRDAISSARLSPSSSPLPDRTRIVTLSTQGEPLLAPGSPLASAATSASPPPSASQTAATTPETTPAPSARTRRVALDPWDRRSFGGRR